MDSDSEDTRPLAFGECEEERALEWDDIAGLDEPEETENASSAVLLPALRGMMMRSVQKKESRLYSPLVIIVGRSSSTRTGDSATAFSEIAFPVTESARDFRSFAGLAFCLGRGLETFDLLETAVKDDESGIQGLTNGRTSCRRM